MTGTCVLVCVTVQRTCERLIRAGAELAAERACQLSVVHVARTGQHFLDSDDEASALEYLFQVSRENGADMTLLHSDDVCKAIIAAAKKCNAGVIVLGAPPKRERGLQLPARLSRLLPEVEVREIVAPND